MLFLFCSNKGGGVRWRSKSSVWNWQRSRGAGLAPGDELLVVDENELNGTHTAIFILIAQLHLKAKGG